MVEWKAAADFMGGHKHRRRGVLSRLQDIGYWWRVEGGGEREQA